MTMSIAAKHAKGKSAQDKIFGANAAAVARMPLPTLPSALFWMRMKSSSACRL